MKERKTRRYNAPFSKDREKGRIWGPADSFDQNERKFSAAGLIGSWL